MSSRSLPAARERPALIALPAWRVHLLAAGALLAAAGVVIAVALIRYPFDGFYGQDSYAYYWQALELWRAATGQAPPAWPFAGLGLYHWPVGYHLHLMTGFLFGESDAPGRALTLLLAAAGPVLVYGLAVAAWRDAPRPLRVAAGLIAGSVLLITGIYLRTGLAVMSDVPAAAWSVAAAFCWVQGLHALWAPSGRRRAARRWFAGAGFALGVAILIRYGDVLLLAPLLVYTVLTWRQRRVQTLTAAAEGIRSFPPSPQPSPLRAEGVVSCLICAIGASAVALLPQVVYLLSYPGARVDTGSLGDWRLANFWSTTVHTADGAATYAHPMAVFYLLEPLWNVNVGFLSPFYLPALALGFVVLVRRRAWPLLGLLATWWLLWAGFLSGIPYQTHRFVLGFWPAVAIAIGIGAASVGAALWRRAMDPSPGPAPVRGGEYAVPSKEANTRLPGTGRRAGGLGAQPPDLALPKKANTPLPGTGRGAGGLGLRRLAAALVVLTLAAGGVHSAWGAKEQVATQAAIKAGELATVALARQAAVGQAGTPQIVSFGLSAALYHYTRWSVLDFYDYDVPAIQDSLDGPGLRLVVLPESSMSSQWLGTPVAARWDWIRAHYHLERVGAADPYTVYRVVEGSAPAADKGASPREEGLPAWTTRMTKN